MMKKGILFYLPVLFFMQAALADGTQYVMRIDGMACPFCAYAIEKKLQAVEGVQRVDVDLEQSLVSVDVSAGTSLAEDQMKSLFRDAGFTYRGMTETPQ